MILERLQIESFAGLTERSVELGEGLNVLLGPNEAGKSTLFQAIRHTLLTPANLSRPQFTKLLKPFLPLGGGDSIACTLHFRHGGQAYRLAKRWGAEHSAELVLPDGSRLRGEESIREALAGLLPAGEGTLRTVFLTAQAALPGTLRQLQEDPEAAGSLADLLRRAVLQPDGLSISAFRRVLDERLQTLLGRWDPERERPEGNRGLDNPWQQNTGEVVQSWYEREGLERKRAEAEAAEDRLAELARGLEACRDELKALDRRVSEREPAAQTVWERRSLAGDLEKRQAELKHLKGDYDRWPDIEKSLARAARELPEAQEKAAALEKQKRQAEEAESRKQALGLLAQARELDQAAARARERQARLPSVLRSELEELEKASAEAQRASLEYQAAGVGHGIAVSFQARADITLRVSKDGEEAGSRALGPGETLTVQARERARLEAPAWTLEAAGAPEDRERRREEAEAARRRFAGLLAARGLASLAAARQACLDFEVAASEAAQAEARLEEKLGGRGLEELERAAAAGPAADTGAAPRELPVVLEELHAAADRLRDLRTQEAADREALEGLVREHARRDALWEGILAATAEGQAMEGRLAALPALPPEAADPEAFLREFNSDKNTREALREREKNLDKEYVRAEENQPEESSEELAGRRDDADRRHRQALRRAHALRTVQSAAEQVLSQSDGGAQQGFERALAGFAAELTAARYRAMPLEGGLPAAMERGDGLRLPFELLSGGTRGLFALALRLAMAEAFLAGGEGFLILDDPLVDLDPERQERASAVLARFADRPGRQVLLFTCHPAHAGRFPEARQVELG
jgi:exonuclease SbcC